MSAPVPTADDHDPLHTVFVPGLLCSPRLYSPVLPAAWEFGEITVADTRHDDSIAAIGERLLDDLSGPFVLTDSRRQQVEMVRGGRFAELAGAAFPVTVAVENEHDEALRANFVTMAEEVGAEAFCRQQRAAITRRDQRVLLPTISCPAAVVHGTGDRLIDPENGRELAEQIPTAQLSLLERCGHSPTLERPDAVASILRDLLGRASASARVRPR